MSACLSIPTTTFIHNPDYTTDYPQNEKQEKQQLLSLLLYSSGEQN